MDYTQSPDFATHALTGKRMHQDTAAVTTAVSSKDMNAVIWSLMELLLQAGMDGIQFDPATPATYQRFRNALNALYVSLPALINAEDADKGDALVAVKYATPAAVALNLHSYIEDDGSYNLMGFMSNAPGVKEAIRNGTTTAAVTTRFQDALATGRKIKVPRGKFIVEAPLNPTQGGVSGESSKTSRIVCDACHAFEIPWNAGFDRPQAVIERLAVDSVSNSCDGKYVVYVPGVAGGAAAVYNSGLLMQHIEWGRNGRFGGLAYLKDLFRCTIKDCGGSDSSQIIKVVGSVVQLNVQRVVCNNDSAANVLPRYGISTETANYSDIGVAGLESGLFERIKFIRGTRGLSHNVGGTVVFADFDVEADEIGYYVNAPCTILRGVVSPGVGATNWIGVRRGVNIADPDDCTMFQGVEVKVLHSVEDPDESYGFDIGDGVSAVHGLVMENCIVHGEAGSLQSAVRARVKNGDARIDGTFVRASTCLGVDIDVQSGRNIRVRDSVVPGGEISVSDGADPEASGEITGNIANSLSLTLANGDRWTVANPAIAGSPTRLVSESKGTFVGTLTGISDGPQTGAVRYIVQGRQITLYFPSIWGTSNSNAATITGLPAALFPNREQNCVGFTRDNGNSAVGTIRITIAGGIELYHGPNLAGFTAAGIKGVNPSTITYSLD